MKQLLFNPLRAVMTVLLSTVLLFSCSQIEPFEASELVESQETIALNFKMPNGLENFKVKAGVNACNRKDWDLNVGNGKYTDLAEVSVYKDDKKLYVTINVHDLSSPWFIRSSHLFIGKINTLGIKKNPAPGKFPEAWKSDKTDNTGDKEFSYEFDLLDKEGKPVFGKGDLDFALHVDLVKVDTDDYGIIMTNGKAKIVQSEGGWVGNIKFTDSQASWATYFVYDVEKACSAPCSPIFTSSVPEMQRKAGVNSAETDEVIIDSYPLFNSGTPVGKVEISYNRNGKYHAEFTLTGADLYFKEVALKYSFTSDIDMNFDGVEKLAGGVGITKLKYDLTTDVPSDDRLKPIYGAVYAHISDNVCNINTPPMD